MTHSQLHFPAQVRMGNPHGESPWGISIEPLGEQPGPRHLRRATGRAPWTRTPPPQGATGGYICVAYNTQHSHVTYNPPAPHGSHRGSQSTRCLESGGKRSALYRSGLCQTTTVNGRTILATLMANMTVANIVRPLTVVVWRSPLRRKAVHFPPDSWQYML